MLGIIACDMTFGSLISNDEGIRTGIKILSVCMWKNNYGREGKNRDGIEKGYKVGDPGVVMKVISRVACPPS